MGDDATDPYFETIPDNELHFYQRKGTKRKRKMPQHIPKQDLKILNTVKNRAYRLDLQLSLCGLRLGWAGIIGLIPWIGDCIALLFALQLVKKAGEVDGGLPKVLQAEMMGNVMVDFGIGLIPFVGDFINILYKCNSRNFILLEKHLIKKYSHGTTGVSEPAGTTTATVTANAPVTTEKVKEKEKQKTDHHILSKTTPDTSSHKTERVQQTGTYHPSLPPRDDVHPSVPPRDDVHPSLPPRDNIHHSVPPIDAPVPAHTIDSEKAAYIGNKV